MTDSKRPPVQFAERRPVPWRGLGLLLVPAVAAGLIVAALTDGGDSSGLGVCLPRETSHGPVDCDDPDAAYEVVVSRAAGSGTAPVCEGHPDGEDVETEYAADPGYAWELCVVPLD